MFNASKAGGSRGSTSSFFRAGAPSYTSSKSPARFFIVPRWVLSETQAATVFTELPRARIPGNLASGSPYAVVGSVLHSDGPTGSSMTFNPL